MKNHSFSAFLFLLAVAIVSGLFFYRQLGDEREALKVDEEIIAGLRERVANLEAERDTLQKQVAGNTVRRGEDARALEEAHERIVQLEKTAAEKDVELARVRGAMEELEKLRAMPEMSSLSSEGAGGRPREQTETIQPLLLSCQNEIKKNREALESLQKQLVQVEEEKGLAERRIKELESAHDALVSELQKQLENQEVTITRFERKLTVTFVDRVLFDFGKVSITPEGMKILRRVGKILKEAKGERIRVVGHTDNVLIAKDYERKFPTNWELSAARAAAVVRYFQKSSGMDPRRMEASGRSFYEPVASNETSEGRAKNRRVEIVIMPVLD